MRVLSHNIETHNGRVRHRLVVALSGAIDCTETVTAVFGQNANGWMLFGFAGRFVHLSNLLNWMSDAQG